MNFVGFFFFMNFMWILSQKNASKMFREDWHLAHHLPLRNPSLIRGTCTEAILAGGESFLSELELINDCREGTVPMFVEKGQHKWAVHSFAYICHTHIYKHNSASSIMTAYSYFFSVLFLFIFMTRFQDRERKRYWKKNIEYLL